MLRSRSRARLLLPAAAAALFRCAGCEGVVRLEVILPESLDNLGGPAQVLVRVEERADPKVSGTVVAVSAALPFDPEAESLALPRIDIPYGSDRVVVVEFLRARDGTVAYYGLSESFDLRRGDDLMLRIPVLRAPPDPEVTIGSASPGYVGEVDVLLSLETGDAIEAHVSNDV